MSSVLLLLAGQALAADRILFTATATNIIAAMRGSLTEQIADGFRLTRTGSHPAPGLTISAPAGGWDLGAFQAVAARVRNAGSTGYVVALRAEDRPHDAGTWTVVTGWTWLEPGESGVVRARLLRPAPQGATPFAMRTGPGLTTEDPEAVDAARITGLDLFMAEPAGTAVLDVVSIAATGALPPLPPASRLFPWADEFGQYRHAEWPGKVRTGRDLHRNRDAEAADLARRPGPTDRDAWGGWRDGPTRTATGRFRTEKIGDRWWLVDPDGRLFFSSGIAVVNLFNATPVTDREHWFAGLTGLRNGFPAFVQPSSGIVRGAFKGRQVESFDFWRANLARKYGTAWVDSFADVTHRRLRSWGVNTIGNWSSPQVWRSRRTPYTVAAGSWGAKPIEGHEGFWHPFPDVFAPAFRDSLRRSLIRELEHAKGDPWCLGVFVDNELSWDDDTALALATLASPAGQPAKDGFIADLRRTHGSIARLNRAWETTHESWAALRLSRTPPGVEAARPDLERFVVRIAEMYFRTCRGEVRRIDPGMLYLGCRFAWQGDLAIRAAARHCDVVSFNLYRRSVAGFTLPKGLDVPALNGEFHFGALDRGLFDPGMIEVGDQAERGKAYTDHVTSALRHPTIVGVHWFQYADQPFTGRPLDGEPAQVGFVDIADTPNPDLVSAARSLAQDLYRIRSESVPVR